VTAVLALSYLSPLPAGAISALAGYGNNGNNCGVKGYGYHDHGKVCPNRPFPGKGEGLEKFLGGAGLTVGGSNAKNETEGIAVTTTDNDTVATGGGVTLSLGKGHGHSNGHAHSHGGE
jgi:hypothetical protein